MAVFSLEDYRAYVEKVYPDVIQEPYLGFKSADFLTHFPDNKGKIIIQDISYQEDPISEWKELVEGDFASQKSDMSHLEVVTALLQMKDKFVPSELQKTYAGVLLQRGQNPADFPFEAYLMDEAMKKIKWQIARLVWQSKPGHASGAVWRQFTGILASIDAGVVATTLTEQSVGTVIVRENATDTAGAGQTAAVDAFRMVYDALPEACKQNETVYIYANPENVRKYNLDYRNRYGSEVTIDPDLRRPILDIAGQDDGRVIIVAVPEMLTNTRIIATPMRNLYYSYDMDTDPDNFNMRMPYNAVHFWSDFRIGGGVHYATNDWMAVSDGE